MAEADIELAQNTYKCPRCIRRSSFSSGIAVNLNPIGAVSGPPLLPGTTIPDAINPTAILPVPVASIPNTDEKGKASNVIYGPDNLSLSLIYEELINIRAENKFLKEKLLELLSSSSRRPQIGQRSGAVSSPSVAHSFAAVTRPAKHLPPVLTPEATIVGSHDVSQVVNACSPGSLSDVLPVASELQPAIAIPPRSKALLIGMGDSSQLGVAGKTSWLHVSSFKNTVKREDIIDFVVSNFNIPGYTTGAWQHCPLS